MTSHPSPELPAVAAVAPWAPAICLQSIGVLPTMMPVRPLLITLMLAAATAAQAQSLASLKTAAERTLDANPELSAKLNAYRAAGAGLDSARGARGPRLDLEAEAGRERFQYRSSPSSTLDRTGVSLRLTQVLWDGLASQREVTRLSHERMARYFELLDGTEASALEAARAAYDVQRFRSLVKLAADNVVEHRKALEKIESRVKAGVGRGVDQEQAQARLALAESNLISERSNLHDVVARYQRIVGEAPQRDAEAPALLDSGLPADAASAVRQALATHPAIQAGVEGVRAAEAAVKLRSAALQPRVELRARAGQGHNFNSLEGRRGDAGAEVVMSWNLFDGGSDRARVREQSFLLGRAQDQRDRACRDVAQIAAIAHNDMSKLREQIRLLQANTDAIERARSAYRQQFDIGQRSLLDLLNAENEAYTAQRALANAKFDAALAGARSQAAQGRLTTVLGLRQAVKDEDAQGWQAGAEAAGRCPALAPNVDAVL